MSGARSARVGMMLGLAAAVTFGASTPFAKRLLDDARPQLLAGLLYLGAFTVLAATLPLRRRRSNEARLRRTDAPRLAGLVLTGGILAPVFLLIGLERISGTSGSLLLNLEGPFTVLIGLAVFGEHLGRRAAVGACAVFVGATLLSLGDAGGSTDLVGAACVALACLLWGVDNNLTQSLTVRDPFVIVAMKTGLAGTVNLTLALALGVQLPSAPVLVAASCLGAVAYGLSVVLDAYALRLLGAAREAVIFATAPFIGAVLAVPVLSETLGRLDMVAAAVMAIGIVIMLAERHDHLHAHEPLEHDHLHVHDEHHRHDHPPSINPEEPHSHVHRHDQLVHAHAHVSDVHHRHGHRDASARGDTDE
jgi:drug/metabolite transporter (DMT)-like permease